MEASNKKRILYVITKSNFGGAQRYVFELAEAMQKNGHEVAVASAPTGLLVEKLHIANITHFPIKSFQRDISVVKEFRVLNEIKKCYKQFRPDIVHLNSSKAGGIGSLVARICGIKQIVFTVHGWPFLEPRSWLWRTLAWTGSWLTGLLSHRVILVSENDQAKTNMPLVLEKCIVIKTAVPKIELLERYEARKKLFTTTEEVEHKSDIWLVTNAELHPNKNLGMAISAVVEHNKFNQQKIYYTIIGEGENRTDLENLIKSLEAETYTKLLGYVDNARNYLLAFDMFLLPSLKEGLPYTLLEAGAAGLPSIASRVGGIPEVITDNETGLLFNPKVPGELERALKTYTLDEELRKEQSQRLKNKVFHDFALDKMVQKTQAVYSSMMDKSAAL